MALRVNPHDPKAALYGYGDGAEAGRCVDDGNAGSPLLCGGALHGVTACGVTAMR